MKKIWLLIGLVLGLYAQDVMMYENSYDILHVDKKIKEISVGDKKILNVSLIGNDLKLYGKGIGHTSILILYRDGSHDVHDVYVNQNLKSLLKMVKTIEPNVELSRLGNGAVTIKGEFRSKKSKKRVYEFLLSAGVDPKKLIDMTSTSRVHKMIRTKLYLVEINNQRAEDLGGITGLGVMNEFFNIAINPQADNGATFSGFLLDYLGKPTSNPTAKGHYSVTGALNFLETKGVAKILDDTILITTEDKNATFRVGGEVYIPTGLTQNDSGIPTIQLEEKEYGLKLTLNTNFMKNDNFMHMRVDIEDSAFDTNDEHNVKLGEFTEVPAFISKNITTEVVAKSGQLIALGGRLHTEDYLNNEKVPLIGDIPVLGEAFKHKEEAKKSNDLLFFLIPEIVDPNDKLDEKDFYKKTKQQNKKLHKEITSLDTPKPIQIKEEVKKEEEVKKVEEPKEEKAEVKITEAKEPIIEESKDGRYKITIGKVFLRSVPKYGEVQAVWIEGHEFVAQNFDIDGEVYLKVKEDCFQNNCVKVENPMWISEKFSKEVI